MEATDSISACDSAIEHCAIERVFDIRELVIMILDNLSMSLYNALCTCKRFNILTSVEIKERLWYGNQYHIIRLLYAEKYLSVQYLIDSNVQLSDWDRAIAAYINFPTYMTSCCRIVTEHDLKFPAVNTDEFAIVGPCIVRIDDGVNVYSPLKCQHELIMYDIEIDNNIIYEARCVSKCITRLIKFMYYAKIPTLDSIEYVREVINNDEGSDLDAYVEYYDYHYSKAEIVDLFVEFCEELRIINTMSIKDYETLLDTINN